MSQDPELKTTTLPEPGSGPATDGGEDLPIARPSPLTPEIRAALAPHKGLGMVLAILIPGAWAIHLGILLFTPLEELGWAVVPAFLIQVFLGTGLFITAHDAIHGTVSSHRWINTLIGWFCTICFATLSYSVLYRNHHAHHRHPGTHRDPDTHDGSHPGPIPWFATFMSHYLNRWIFLLYVPLVWVFLVGLLGAPLQNALLFWPTPAIFSAIQLFSFGTWLPHRDPPGGHTNIHRTQSNGYGTLLSFLTCYHFGYHLEHHQVPMAPWWKLPTIRRLSRLNTRESSIS